MTGQVGPFLAAETDLFGVRFRWPNPGEDWNSVARPGREGMYRRVLDATRPHISRQHRTFVSYWDAMTYLLGPGDLAERKKIELSGLAMDMAFAIQVQQLHPFLLDELNRTEMFKRVRSEFVVIPERSEKASLEQLDRTSPGAIEYTSKGKWQAIKPGSYRRLTLDMPDLCGDPTTINWLEVGMTAVMIQMYNEICVFLESGYWRVVFCARPACRGFFRAKRMGTRSMYCSNSCRSSEGREHAQSA